MDTTLFFERMRPSRAPKTRNALTASTPVHELKNLGPVSVGWLHELGCHTRADLEALGAVMAYKILKHHHPRDVNRNLLYALHGALTDTHWTSISPDVKAALRAEADTPMTIGPG